MNPKTVCQLSPRNKYPNEEKYPYSQDVAKKKKIQQKFNLNLPTQNKR